MFLKDSLRFSASLNDFSVGLFVCFSAEEPGGSFRILEKITEVSGCCRTRYGIPVT